MRESFAAVNAAVCAAIGPDALPLAGDEVGLEAEQVPELGLVGQPVPSCPPAVVAALELGRVPVVSPLARGPLNVNADEMATALAVGPRRAAHPLPHRRARRLPRGPPAALDPRRAKPRRSSASGTFDGGIVPKLLAASRAARSGLQADIGATAVVA